MTLARQGRYIGWTLALVAAACAPADKGIVYHPYVSLDLPLPGVAGPIAAADPAVVKAGDTWYLYPTAGEGGFHVWSSTDLQTWRYGGRVWSPTPGSWNDTPAGNYWAPHVQRAPEGYYLYYTANGRIGVAFAKTPVGPFVDALDHPLMGGGYGGTGDGVYKSSPYNANNADALQDFEEYAIDAFVLAASDGSLTLYASTEKPYAVISALPLVNYTTPADVPPTVVLDMDSDPSSGWEFVTREGPWIVEHAGTFHLMYSGSTFWSPCYAVGIATATSPMGPFTRRADNPFLHEDRAAQFWGPGHNSVVEGAHHDLLMFFHAKVSATDGDGFRRIQYAPVSFGEDGQLRFSTPPPGDSAPGHSPLCSSGVASH